MLNSPSSRRVIVRFFPAGRVSTLNTKDIERNPKKAPIITRTISDPKLLADAVVSGKAFIQESAGRYNFDTRNIEINYELVGPGADSGSITSNQEVARKFLTGETI